MAHGVPQLQIQEYRAHGQIIGTYEEEQDTQRGHEYDQKSMGAQNGQMYDRRIQET